MDIGRLNPYSPARPGPAPRPAPPVPLARADTQSTNGATREAEAGRVLQGELMYRADRVRYQTTRAYLDERALGRARVAQDPGTPPAFIARAAVSRYGASLGGAVSGARLDLRA